MSIQTVRAAIAAAREIDPAAGLALRFAAVAGRRRAELAALQWADVHADVLTVDKAVELVQTAQRGKPDLRLAPTKRPTAGQAVWCHHALQIEAIVDRNDGTTPAGTGSNRSSDRARHEITIAHRVLEASDHPSDPAECAKLVEQAAALREAAHRRLAVQRAQSHRMSPYPQTPWSPGIDNSPERRGPELSL